MHNSYMFCCITLRLPGPSAGVSGSLDSYCSLKPLCSGMREVVPARTSPTLHPPSPRTVLSLSCFKVSQCIIFLTHNSYIFCCLNSYCSIKPLCSGMREVVPVWDNIFTPLKFHSRVVILYNMSTPGWIYYIIWALPGEHWDIICSPWPWYFCPRGDNITTWNLYPSTLG